MLHFRLFHRILAGCLGLFALGVFVGAGNPIPGEAPGSVCSQIEGSPCDAVNGAQCGEGSSAGGDCSYCSGTSEDTPEFVCIGSPESKKCVVDEDDGEKANCGHLFEGQCKIGASGLVCEKTNVLSEKNGCGEVNTECSGTEDVDA